MSGFAITLIVLAAISTAVSLALTAALFIPVVVEIDSARSQLRVRWALGMEYRRPLPGGTGEKRFWLAGKRVALGTRKRKPKAKRAKPAERRRRGRGAAAARFFYRCLRDTAIRRRLLRQLAKLRRGIFRSVEMKRRRVRVSLPDPALTGMLAGLAQSGWAQRWGVEANFTGENSVFLEIRLRPHRIVKPVVSFLTGLPYRAMFKEWRSATARAPAR